MPMTTTCISAPASVAPSDLIAYSLGRRDAELDVHLAACAWCRAQVERYRSLLTSMRQVLTGRALDVRFVACRRLELAGENQCVAEDADHSLTLVMAQRDGVLYGQIVGCSDACLCWQGATVRLFGSQGFVVSSQVDENGVFQLRGLQAGKQYTVGLVIMADDYPQLRIIGEFPG